MPFLLSFFLFLNGGVWSAYSVLVKDFYIGVSSRNIFVICRLSASQQYMKKTTLEMKSDVK
jgi:solute carrier family 50 protein (sugar transporter)